MEDYQERHLAKVEHPLLPKDKLCYAILHANGDIVTLEDLDAELISLHVSLKEAIGVNVIYKEEIYRLRGLLDSVGFQHNSVFAGEVSVDDRA